jgi:hypothetical protein
MIKCLDLPSIPGNDFAQRVPNLARGRLDRVLISLWRLDVVSARARDMAETVISHGNGWRKTYRDPLC